MKKSVFTRGFALCLALVCWSAGAAPVTRTERDALVVVELSHGVEEKLKSFYETIENLALKQAETLRPAYRKVTVLKGATATVGSFVAHLKHLTGRTANRAVDLYINLHGSPGGLLFYDGKIQTVDLRNKISDIKGAAAKLRAVYSTACFGKSHVADWLAAGFKVASGAVKVNANSAYEVPVFFRRWTGGETYAKALTAGNSENWRRTWDRWADQFGFGPADSFKESEGRPEFTIDSSPDGETAG